MTLHSQLSTLNYQHAEAITRARSHFRPPDDRHDTVARSWFPKSPEAEGGCGVTGFACTVPLLQIKPPDVARYFVRVKPDVLDRFAAEKSLADLPDRDLEDEFVFQNSVELNRRFYASLGEKRAFVASHARNLLVLKIVGYAEALVHNGDFANYHSVCEFLAQRNLFPQFLTDTEVSVLLFDLMHRVYRYPVEYIIEALAPTTELDFDRLPAERRRIYRKIQAVIDEAIRTGDAHAVFSHLCECLTERDYDWLRWFVDQVAVRTADERDPRRGAPALGIEALTLSLDHCYPTGDKKRSSVQTILRAGLETLFQRQPLCGQPAGSTHRRINWDTRDRLCGPENGETTLLIDAGRFPPEGADCDARLAIEAYKLGWRHIVHFASRGTRFHAAGFGPNTDGLRIDCYDNPGDYLGSGMDGLEAYVHGNAQDQLCQIAKSGKLVVFGVLRKPADVYRKVMPRQDEEIEAELEGMGE